MSLEIIDLQISKSEPSKKGIFEPTPLLQKEEEEEPLGEEDIFTRFIRLMQERLMHQNKNYKAWEAHDSERKGLKLLSDFREESDTTIDQFYMKTLEYKRKFLTEKIRLGFVEREWKQVQGSLKCEKGLYIRNQMMVFSKELFNVRSLSLKMILSFKLLGNSAVGIVSHTMDYRNEDGFLLRINKEGTRKNPKLFLSIGRKNENGNDFLIIKRCEIPVSQLREENVEEDYINCCLHLMDVGNDKIAGKIEVNQDFITPFTFEYSRIILPYFEDFPFNIISYGEAGVYIKKVCLELVERPSQYLGAAERERGNCLCNIF